MHILYQRLERGSVNERIVLNDGIQQDIIKICLEALLDAGIDINEVLREDNSHLAG